MRKTILAAVAIATMAAPMLPTAAMAQYHDDRDHRDDGGRGPDGRGPGGPGGRGPGGDYRWNGDQGRDWRPEQHYRGGRYPERRLGRNDRIYRGGDGRYYCRRNDGTTGLVIGAIGGGVLGGAIGGDTLGALVGAGAGALLGRSVDRGQVRCR